MDTDPTCTEMMAPAQPVSDEHAEMWALVERAQAGDTAAWGEIYKRYANTVYLFVYGRVLNRQLAHDVTSDTFERAIKRIGGFTYMGRDIEAWLITIARNLIVNHFKSPHRRREVMAGEALINELRADPSPEGNPEDAALNHIDNLTLLAAVQQLNPEQQECIVLRFLCNKNIRETAQIMGSNVGAIKALQGRAVRTLARILPAELFA